MLDSVRGNNNVDEAERNIRATFENNAQTLKGVLGTQQDNISAHTNKIKMQLRDLSILEEKLAPHAQHVSNRRDSTLVFPVGLTTCSSPTTIQMKQLEHQDMKDDITAMQKALGEIGDNIKKAQVKMPSRIQLRKTNALIQEEKVHAADESSLRKMPPRALF